MNDPKLAPGTNYCKCTVCGEYFNSEAPFDMHRARMKAERSCKTHDEMLAQGMSISGKGYWITSERTGKHLPAG